jgi:hypothetical protein
VRCLFHWRIAWARHGYQQLLPTYWSAPLRCAAHPWEADGLCLEEITLA